MDSKSFKKLLKNDNPKHIIYMHCDGRIYLTRKQLDKVICLKNGKGSVKNERID